MGSPPPTWRCGSVEVVESMPHKRSLEALQRRAAKRFVIAMAYRDKYAAEVVNRLSSSAVLDYVARAFHGRVHLGAIPGVEPGEVLYDSRGRGSFQGAPHKHGDKALKKVAANEG